MRRGYGTVLLADGSYTEGIPVTLKGTGELGMRNEDVYLR